MDDIENSVDLSISDPNCEVCGDLPEGCKHCRTKTCAIEGCGLPAMECADVDLCVEHNHEWRNSEECLSAEHVAQMARESFLSRKATALRVTAGLDAMVESLRPTTVVGHG